MRQKKAPQKRRPKSFRNSLFLSIAPHLAMTVIEQLFSEVNPIPVKKAVSLMGYEAGPLRMPLTEMEPEHAQKLGEAMETFGISLV